MPPRISNPAGRASSPERPAGVAFDLDGTLVDSRRDLASAVNRLRGERGLQPVSLAAVGGMVGEGARVLVERALADTPPGDLDADLARFLEHYAAVCVDTTRPYPGVEALLHTAAARWPLAVLTNKPEGLSRRVLSALGLDSRFQVVVGGDTLPVRKPAAEAALHVARSLGVEPPALLLVGDSGVDARTASAAGCRLALVLWGYGDAAELAAAEAEVKAASAAELDSWLAAL
jgi:phosphoglycolate phosphatase